MSAELDEQYRTRPGTPMIGPYSTNQMDDFYAALARGEAKSSGLMNLMQHLIVAERCADGANVLDVCCGRGLALPMLHRYAPKIARYVGLDISPGNLAEARTRLTAPRQEYGNLFPVEFVEHDVSAHWPELPKFDVALYTSALEHLPYELGVKSLLETGNALGPGECCTCPRRRRSDRRRARCSTGFTCTSGRARRSCAPSRPPAWSWTT